MPHPVEHYPMTKESTPKGAKKTPPISKKPESTLRDQVEKFVGKVENFHEIKIHNVFDDKYRVNVWVKWVKEGMFGYSYKIEQSYFMKFSDGTLTDLTKAPLENKPYL